MEKKQVFENMWYRITVDSKGNMAILDQQGREIVSSLQYTAQYGEIYNATFPLKEGDTSIQLNKPPLFKIGERVEIRNEYRQGLLNRPFIHQATVTSIENETLSFYPAITEEFSQKQIFTNKFSIYIKQVTHRCNEWNMVSMEYDEDSFRSEQRLKIIGETSKSIIKVNYTFHRFYPEIGVAIDTQYKENIKVFNEAFKLIFAIDVSEVYRKNRQVDTENFQEEYWLDKQGVKFGTGKRSALVYHVPHISSLQLETKKRMLTINLDDMNDHRYRRMVQNLKHEGRNLGVFYDYHAAEYKAGEIRKNQYSLLAGFSPSLMPRLMLNPNGYLAAHVWTEHADKSTLASHKAVYYGHEDVQSSTDAVGGFVKHNIPVTKSIFYSNPSRVPFLNYSPRDEQDRINYPSQVAIKQDPGFLEFLKELHSLGHEICLHAATPDSRSQNREVLKEALFLLQKLFHSESFIDHGRNPSNISSDGLTPSSRHYAHDLWQQCGIKFFWHYSTEDIVDCDFGNIDIMQMKFGDHFRTPLYYRHPTVTHEYYSWPAIVNPWLKYYSQEALLELIGHWSVCINHGYPPEIPDRPTKTSQYLYKDSNGKWVIDPIFDQLLEHMASLRDQGLLHLTTIREMMDYWLKLEKVKIQYLIDGNVVVYNENHSEIEGLSLTVENTEPIYIGGEIPRSKRIGKDLVCWFDMKPMSHVIISTKPND